MGAVLTVVTWKWQGWRPVYNAGHVNTLMRMLRAYLHMPFRMVCVTDDPVGIECETYPLWQMPPIQFDRPQNSFARLKLFDQATACEISHTVNGYILSIDLDCVILDDITPIITPHVVMDTDFVGMSGYPVTPINGSMFLLRSGGHPEIWNEFDPIETPKLISQTIYNHKRICGSDQAWLSMKLAGAPTWGKDHGIYQYLRLPQRVRDLRIVFFAGQTKPWDTACLRRYPELFKIYQSFQNRR